MLGRMAAGTAALAVVLALVACGGEEPYDGLLEPPPPGRGVQFGFSVDLAPGQEGTFCRYFALPGDSDMDVARFEHRFSGTSHHVLVYTTSIPVAQAPTGVVPDCLDDGGARDRVMGVAFGSQSEHDVAALPDGVGMPLYGSFALIVEFHVLNTTDAPTTAEVAVNLWQAEDELVGEAGTLFYFHDLIAVPAGGTATVRKRCAVAADVTIMSALPHMHSRGTAFRADLIGGGAAPRTIIDVTGWDADTIDYEPHIAVTAGQEIDFTCSYRNTGSTLIVDGPSAKRDEMCVLGALYYRPTAPRLPITDETCSSASSIVYQGTQTCSQTLPCGFAIDWNNDPAAADKYELCRVQTCNGSGHAYTALGDCIGQSCFGECARVPGLSLDDPACSACVAASCSAERSACEAATCP